MRFRHTAINNRALRPVEIFLDPHPLAPLVQEAESSPALPYGGRFVLQADARVGVVHSDLLHHQLQFGEAIPSVKLPVVGAHPHGGKGSAAHRGHACSGAPRTPICYGGKVGKRLVHMLATQRPASATPRTINNVVIAMRSEYSISELPPQSRQRRANSFISCTG